MPIWHGRGVGTKAGVEFFHELASNFANHTLADVLSPYVREDAEWVNAKTFAIVMQNLPRGWSDWCTSVGET